MSGDPESSQPCLWSDSVGSRSHPPHAVEVVHATHLRLGASGRFLLEEDEVSDELLIVNEGPCDVECAAPIIGPVMIDNASMGDSLLDQSYCNLTIINRCSVS